MSTSTANTTSTVGEAIKPAQTNSSKTFLLRYSFAFICVILSGFAMKMAANDPNAANNNYYMYLTMVLLPLIIAGFIILPLFSEGFNFSLNLALISVVTVGIISVYYFMKMIVNAEMQYVGYFMYFLGFAITIVLLAMIYKIFYRIIRNVKGTWGFVVNLIFLIPCFFLDTIELLFADFKNTSNSIKLLFGIEIILIYLFFNLKGLFRNKSSEITLLGEPHDLYEKRDLGSDEIMYSSAEIFRENYGLSMWIYINTSHKTHGRPIPIFTYGNISEDGTYLSVNLLAYPLIQYDQTTQKLKITISSEKSILLDIDGQKWNHLAISMDNGYANIFINGELVKTLPYENTEMGEAGRRRLSAGWNTKYMDGLLGAICNVIYYKKPLTPEQISRHYNYYLHKNPPI